MSVIGEFTVPAESFALPEALTAAPAVTVEAERLATHSTMEVLPFLWADGGDHETFHDDLAADPTVVRATVADETEGGTLFKVHWHDRVPELVDEMVDHHATIVEASGRDGEWRLKLRFVEESQVTEFREHFAGRRFEVRRLYHPTAPHQREYDLTAEQHAALVAALQSGYFGVPREASVEDLGDELGISANAVSQRLRRGSANLVRNALTFGDADADDAGSDAPTRDVT